MIKVVSYEIRQWHELDEATRIKAVNKHRDINVDRYDYANEIIKDFEAELQSKGFIGAKISYSGFWSQGDGLCFDCDSIDTAKFLPSRMKGYAEYITLDIRKNGHANYYSHRKTRYIDSEYEISDSRWVSKARGIATKEAKANCQVVYLDACREYYRLLEKDYDYLTSDEAVIDTIKANEYYFDSDGNIDNN